MTKISKLSIQKVGDQYELFIYDRPIRIGTDKKTPKIRDNRSELEKFNQREIDANKNKFKTITKIRKYVLHNFKNPNFYTLTFDPKICNFDIKDIKSCYLQFKLFHKRLTYNFGYFDYLCVPEFHKSGAVHFHFLANLKFIAIKDFSNLWGLGFCYIQKTRDLLATSLYVGKYITKSYLDPRFINVRRFRKSNKLQLPEVFYQDKAKRVLNSLQRNNFHASIKKTYFSPINGFINYFVIRKKE